MLLTMPEGRCTRKHADSMEVAPNIHRIETAVGERFACVFLLTGREHSLVYDSGMNYAAEQSIAPYLRDNNIDPRHVRYVIISHSDFDHSGGGAPLRQLFPNALFMCHELDREETEDVEMLISRRLGEFEAAHGIADSDDTKQWIRGNVSNTKIDLTLAGGERIDLGGWKIDVLHTPGHSRGHMSLYDPQSRTAVIGDAVLWNTLSTRDGKPAFPPTYRYVDTYLATIQRLEHMPIDTLLTGHFPVYRGREVAEFLAESRAYVERIDDALRQTLRSSRSPLTLRELTEQLGPVLGNWPAGAEIFLDFPFAGHLERLVALGQVREQRQEHGLTAYSWAGNSGGDDKDDK